MAGRATYTDKDKARAYVALATNEGNVKRTARELGVPENTIRRWKRDFEENGPPDYEEVEVAVGDFVKEADEVRFLALAEIKRLILAQKAKVGELNAVMGTLTDKIDRAHGVAMGRVVHEHTLPSPDEIRGSLLALIEGAQESHRIRDEEIVDAELVEQPALPPGR